MKNRTIAKDQKLQALKALPLFASLDDRDLEVLGRICDRVIVRPGGVLISQGRVETHMAIIIDGAASVAIDDAEVAVLGPGASVGEIAMIDDRPATATVTAIERTTVWYIARAGFLPIWQANPELSTVLLRDVTAKLRATDELMANRGPVAVKPEVAETAAAL